jgi:hypothetical protein
MYQQISLSKWFLLDFDVYKGGKDPALLYEEFINKTNENIVWYWPVIDVVSKDDAENKRDLCDKE